MSILRRIEKSLDHRLRSIFSAGRDEPGAREAIELYRDALDQIATRATIGKRGDRIFPFNRITIELQAEDPERKAVLETLFDPAQLGDDVRSTLEEERIAPPPELTVAVHYSEDALVEMRIVCERGENSAPAPVPALPAPPPSAAPVAIAPARLRAIDGMSSPPELILDRPRINLGRETEVVDTMGRTIRRNDLSFPEEAHEANPSVSRSHAHIAFDGATGQWRIFDDGSSLGTVLFREGRRIDVPAHAGRGVALRPGDEIYLGQVRLRFEAVIS
ncbi:MAG TPA: FHA domain-containing protein [Bryobacteraceae bacterium]|nr:FHA domain-containing protein [Bryobacteraceae bacterium]